MDWFKKHVDACIVMTTVIGCFWWMNSSIHHLEMQMNSRFSEIEKEVAILKTVMIMQKIMPVELAHGEEGK